MLLYFCLGTHVLIVLCLFVFLHFPIFCLCICIYDCCCLLHFFKAYFYFFYDLMSSTHLSYMLLALLAIMLFCGSVPLTILCPFLFF